MSTRAQVELAEGWRKAGFYCEPFDIGEPEKAEKFVDRFILAMDTKSYDSDAWTGGDVLRGDDEGGVNNPIGAMPAAVRNSKTRKHETRCKSVAAILLNHLLNDAIREDVRNAGGAARDAHAMIQYFRATYVGTTLCA